MFKPITLDECEMVHMMYWKGNTVWQSDIGENICMTGELTPNLKILSFVDRRDVIVF